MNKLSKEKIKNGMLITGTLEALEPEDKVTEDGNITRALNGIIFYNDFKVIIPPHKFGVYEVKNSKELQNYHEDPLSKYLRNYLGSEITFEIEYFDEKEGVAFGNRISALEKLKKESFNNILKGDIVAATVVAISSAFAVVEYSGFQISIPKEELAWGRIYDINDYVKIGEKVNALVIDKNQLDCSLSLSLRLATTEPYKELIEKKQLFVVGGEYLARLRAYSDDGIFIELRKGLTVMCNYPSWLEDVENKMDSTVVVKIKRFKPDKRYIDGSLIKIIS